MPATFNYYSSKSLALIFMSSLLLSASSIMSRKNVFSHSMIFSNKNSHAFFSTLLRSTIGTESHDESSRGRTAIVERLEGLKLSQLKEILKKFDVKPKDMRKADIIEKCTELLMQKFPAKTSENAVNFISENRTSAQRQPRSLPSLSASTSGSYVSSPNSTSVIPPPTAAAGGYSSEGLFSSNIRHPVGDKRDLRLNYTGGSEMDLTFLGTASCVPSISRGVSCMALRINSDVWLFDCGEASQVQLQKSNIRPSRIKKIFITHAHGDHSFGLPGVLCLMGQSTMVERGLADLGDEVLEPVDIYGPEGTRDLIRSVIQLTFSRVVVPHRIHELKNVPNLMRGKNGQVDSVVVRTRWDPVYGEKEGSRDIYPNADGQYLLLEEGEMKVYAAPLVHTVPCVGFVVAENDRPGRLRVEKIAPLVEKNKDALKTKLGLTDANKAYAILKTMKPGNSFTFPDGTVLSSEEIVDPPKRGRRLVILGDTSNSDSIVPLAKNADLLVHEATNAWIREMEVGKHTTPQVLERETMSHGHSTPQMAGRFCRQINAKRLILSHFSPRYRGDPGLDAMRIMWRLEDLAREESGLSGRNDVIAAWDLMSVPII